MLVIERKPESGKKRCDYCQQPKGGIVECQVPMGKRGKKGYPSSHWIDLCEDCRKDVSANRRRYADLDTFAE